MPDPTEPVNMVPVNYENWGKLVKTWATGEDYVKNGHPYAVPTSLAEVKHQLRTAQTGLVLPERIKHLQVVVGRSDTLLLRLPPPDLVKASEGAAGNRGLQPARLLQRALRRPGADPIARQGSAAEIPRPADRRLLDRQLPIARRYQSPCRMVSVGSPAAAMPSRSRVHSSSRRIGVEVQQPADQIRIARHGFGDQLARTPRR